MYRKTVFIYIQHVLVFPHQFWFHGQNLILSQDDVQYET